ncbi:efflux transporter outer membrane subunit [Crenobacter sp. SG2305]|uniref:efflux transporter outer membrane subunit n=1 Tax=Crenobacter oryzisoli TaxID=3056844 RepID=UPI0025AA817B|nr:efflux transporter outer membrane subunit [Crenobacter sp. SG2305]MDN0083868.1 efflux transporter outer membrane subunit [Crenobacter sp. SG2305]
MKRIYSGFASSGLRITPLLAVLVLAGCAALPHQQAQSTMRAPAQADFVMPGSDPWPEANWWQQFGDPQLDQLVKLALQNSPSLETVKARIDTARASVDLTRAQAGATLDLNTSVSRQRFSANTIYPPPFGGNIFNEGRMTLDFHYDFDWWGKQKAALEAALGRHRAAEAETAGAAQTLIAAVSETYFQYQADLARLALAKQDEGVRQQLVTLQQQRVRAGLEAGETAEPLTADLESAHQQVLALENDAATTLNQLRGLVGVRGDAFPVLAARPLPQANGGLPANLPLNLVGRRADIAAAREQIYAAGEEVKQAKAEFYPDINLSAFIGVDSLDLGKMFKNSSHILGVTPALSLPIFHSGALQANLRGAEANVTLAVAQYNQTLQQAVQEVNDAALRLKGTADEATPLNNALAARQRDAALFGQQARAGLADGRNSLRARAVALSLQDQQLQLQTRALIARVDLYKALGGGYRDAAASPATAAAAR